MYRGFRAVTELPAAHRVAYQGVEGAYGNLAALHYFGENRGIRFLHLPCFEETVNAVEAGHADYAVLPIENSTAGSVTDTYDLLMHHFLSIVGECFLPVTHSLLTLPGVREEELRRVYSHPQGLMQCADFFRMHPELEGISCSNTAVAAQKVRDDADRTQAAIASAYAGALYGLTPLIERVNRFSENTTRFVILGREKLYRRDARKLSLVLETAHEAGALYHILGYFYRNRVNLLRLESRPVPEVSWEYRFFMDIEGNLGQPAVLEALQAVAAKARGFRVLGCC